MTRHNSLFVQERYEDVAERTPSRRRAKRLQNAYAYHEPRTHQRRSHYLMAPTYVFAVSRSLREQSDMPETDRLPTTSTLPPFHPHPLFSSSLFFSFFFLFSYSTLRAPLSTLKRKIHRSSLFSATEEYYRRKFHNSGILRLRQFRNFLLSKFLCFYSHLKCFNLL